MKSSVQVDRKTNSANTAGVLTSAATGLNLFMEEHGVDADNLLRRHGFDQACLQNSMARVPLSSYCSIFEEAARESANQNFGLLYGSQFQTESLGLLGFLILSSDSLGDALENLVEFFPIHQQKTVLSLDTRARHAELSYRVDSHVAGIRRQDAEMSMGCFLNIFRVALGTEWAPSAIKFEHERLRSINTYSNVFGCEASFECDFNSIVFDREVLSAPMPGRNSSLLRVMRESLALVPMDQGQGGADELDFVRVVRAEIEQNISSADSSLESISDILKIPAWTVKRRLAEHGLTFSSLVDEVRKKWATHYLRQSKKTVSEIAFMLGYSEVSALSRAFTRWYGLSPLQWRRSLDS
ncbi:AraC family transcriptional regulator [Pseudomonas aeruginosa]|uniref:AraC-like transcriptional regulator QhpR n=1 Tax=Pseudomonas aeruginosa TaxID=287 RepID=UPI000F526A51|nr:AraC family transcriptional regulator [Pseudomonas aeruginosa]MCS7970487.1 AraC family transcriptional regulator [Pseudomonas aeruginosa]MCS8138627.1 AraC family transcriptional regulator [Pseudomonas aeruginosa]MCS8181018.1 AraC family transcriptional regulator [Pseudomonas aeruginosa]MCS8193665.1 AraC family transcriptional regulator [Pseudomonas aeruginosa]MCT0923076.1 AraC family transcriptional regulator [Pseudomonas aeruginosa]